VCRRKYTPEPKEQGYAQAIRQHAVESYVDGLNFRRIARMLKVSHTSVMNWVKAHADSLPDAAPLPARKQVVNELDELFTFVEEKKTGSMS
jgi:transposase-like protein